MTLAEESPPSCYHSPLPQSCLLPTLHIIPTASDVNREFFDVTGDAFDSSHPLHTLAFIHPFTLSPFPAAYSRTALLPFPLACCKYLTMMTWPVFRPNVGHGLIAATLLIPAVLLSRSTATVTTSEFRILVQASVAEQAVGSAVVALQLSTCLSLVASTAWRLTGSCDRGIIWSVLGAPGFLLIVQNLGSSHTVLPDSPSLRCVSDSPSQLPLQDSRRCLACAGVGCGCNG